MKVYLSMSPDKQILIQGRLEDNNSFGEILYYVSSGTDFNGVSYDDLAKATPGAFELPEQPNSGQIQPDTSSIPEE